MIRVKNLLDFNDMIIALLAIHGVVMHYILYNPLKITASHS